jgi:hypothetical protein
VKCLAVPLVALGLAACGTTVPQGAATSALQPGGGLAVAPGAAVPTAATSGYPGAAVTGAGAAGAPTATTPTASFGPGGGRIGSIPTVSGVNGPGVTATTIAFGFPYTVNGAEANSAAGASGITQGDELKEAQALVADINKHGGVAGRRLVLVPHALDATSTQTTDQQEAAECADLTGDHKVFGAIAGTPNMLDCLDKARAVEVLDNLAITAAQTFRRHPYLAEVSMFDLDRLARNEVKALVDGNYFTPWNTVAGGPGTGAAKIGFITFDQPDFRSASTGSMLPALARAGHPVASSNIAYVHVPANSADLSSTSAAISSAVLRFQQNGVTHVLMYDAGGTLTLLFTTSAESQHYRPRYGVNSNNGLGLLVDGGQVQPAQAVGAVGMGWFPSLDVPDSANPDNGPYSNAARRRCIAIMNAAGITTADANSKAVPLLFCNAFWFFKEAVEKGVQLGGGATIDRDTYLAGVNALGSSFQSAMTFGTSFSATKHDGAAFYRRVAWDQPCGCMKYTSGNVAAP